MAIESFNYGEYLDMDITPSNVELTEDGYNIKVECQTTNFSNPFDKAGAQVLKNLTFHICTKGKKLEVADYGKCKELNDYQRSKLEILKRQMPNFFKKHKDAKPEHFALWARKLLRPMRDCHCENRINTLTTFFNIA